MLRSRNLRVQRRSLLARKVVKRLLPQVRVAVSLSHHLQRGSSASSSSQSQAPKSSNESQSSASQSQAPKEPQDSQASSSQSSSQAQAKTDMQVTTVDMDVSAVARGQFDSIAGTWKSSDGSRLVFNNTSLVGDITAQGQATVHNYVHPKDNYQEGSGKYDATLSKR